MPAPDRRAAATLGVVLFFSYAYFYQAGGWNQNSRFALIRAVIERSTLSIDAYAAQTGDRALWQGHFYSDKAPGQSMMAFPAVAAARLISRAARVDPESFPGLAWTSYVAAVVTSSLLTVVAALALMWQSRRWGASRGASIFAAAAFGLATPAWAYATLFMGHAPAAGLLMIAFCAAVALDQPDPRIRHRLAWIVGLAGSWAVVTDFPSGVPSILIGLLALWQVRRRPVQEVIAILSRMAIGIAIAALPLFVYNSLAFGAPLHLGYASEEGFQQLHNGFFGITTPRPHIIRELLIGSYRGLLPIAPVMALAPVGLWLLVRRRDTRAAALVACATPIFYLALNSSYYYWEGGWAYGTRHLIPSFPFVCLGLAPLWDRRHVVLRGVLIAAAAWGMAVTFVAVATTPQPPSNLTSPVTQLLWPAFKDGDLALNRQTFVTGGASADEIRDPRVPKAAWNLGQLALLPGLWSLVPLEIAWILGVVMLLPEKRAESDRPA